MQNRRVLRRVEAPVVVIWGEEDRSLRTELAEPETSWVPSVRVERLVNASHWVQQDSFHKVNALLLEFLRAPNRSGGTGNVNTSRTLRDLSGTEFTLVMLRENPGSSS